MEDGRILFMDPVIKGQKYMELKASKDSVRMVLPTVKSEIYLRVKFLTILASSAKF